MKPKTVLFAPLAVLTFTMVRRPVRAQEPRPATLTQQKMCADQAKRSFAEWAGTSLGSGKIGPYTYYTSHYDAKANVCYIMVTDTYSLGKSEGITCTSSVYDAFERRLYAKYIWKSDKVKKAWEVPPITCFVKPLGQKNIDCKSEDEFNELVEKHFGIGL